MRRRNGSLQLFVEAFEAAFDQGVRDPRSRRSMRNIFSALERPGTHRSYPGRRLPLCNALASAFVIETPHETLDRLLTCFRDIEPSLEWRRRPIYEDLAGGSFVNGHANMTIFGPGGLEERDDVWLGVSLLAPHVRYPDRNHVPEETYLVLSDGEFRQGEGEWFKPGIGGSFYNKPNIRHAMRSADTPLFAFWAQFPDGAR